MEESPKFSFRKLPPLKVIYILSLAVLGVLLILTFFQPRATGKEYSTVQKEQVIKTKNGWDIQFELVNVQEENNTYEINEMLDTGVSYRGSVTIPGGGAYVFTHHIYSDDVVEGKVNYLIYKNNELEPVEKLTYFLK
jgi:hypothetical protein